MSRVLPKLGLQLPLAAFLTAVVLSPAPAVAASTGPACDPGGLRPLLAAGNVLLVGEIHGGVEGPALLGAAICAAAREGLAVTVALEIPFEEEPRIERFLASPGSPADRETLLAGPFWVRDYQDGRSSTAMLQLLDDLRGDYFMGKRLVAAVESAGVTGLVIAYAGNIHTRTTPGAPGGGARHRVPVRPVVSAHS